jgi:hypothetical protein
MRAFAIALLVALCAGPAAADDALWALLRQGGQVVLVRHALTDPGIGDPPGFKLDDCRTRDPARIAFAREADVEPARRTSSNAARTASGGSRLFARSWRMRRTRATS